MDQWAHPKQYDSYRTSLFRNQYNALGKSNIDAIGRIVQLKYQRGPEFNRQHPFVDVLLADIIESGEVLDMRDNPPKDYLTNASLPKPVALQVYGMSVCIDKGKATCLMRGKSMR